MPLTKKGNTIMNAMQKEYGPEKAQRVFFASRNAGKITGVDPESTGKQGRALKTLAARRKKVGGYKP